MPYIYGGNVVKAHVGRWSEDCPEHQGVVVLGMDDTPLVGSHCLALPSTRLSPLTFISRQGFGVTARSTAEVRKLDPTGIAVFRQADVGEYLREVSAALKPISFLWYADVELGRYFVHDLVYATGIFHAGIFRRSNNLFGGIEACFGCVKSFSMISSYLDITIISYWLFL